MIRRNGSDAYMEINQNEERKLKKLIYFAVSRIFKHFLDFFVLYPVLGFVIWSHSLIPKFLLISCHHDSVFNIYIIEYGPEIE